MSETTLMTDAATNNESASPSAAVDATQTTATNTVDAAAAAPADSTTQQSTEDKTAAATQDPAADGKPGEDSKDADAKPAGAPEKYEFKAPEGREFDAQVLEQFSEVFKGMNLSQEEAQAAIDKFGNAFADKQTRLMAEANAKWQADATADKEFGGDKLSENLAVAKKALDTFGTTELSKLLNESGLGNHPEIIRAFFKAGKAISEDRIVTGGQGSPTGSRDAAKSLYPNQ